LGTNTATIAALGGPLHTSAYHATLGIGQGNAYHAAFGLAGGPGNLNPAVPVVPIGGAVMGGNAIPGINLGVVDTLEAKCENPKVAFLHM
jgi:hypothetical protein